MVVTTMMMDYMEMETPSNNNNTKTTFPSSPSSSSYQQYMLALQEERRKIQVFHRELPLCLDLVNQAIENCKQHVYSGERSQCAEEDEHQQQQQQQTSSEEPILEEFIPLKRTEEEKSDNNNNINKCDEKNGKKVDWLRSVQLWNQHPDSPSQETSPRIKENGGAFHRFGEEKVKVGVKAVSTTTTPSVVKEPIPKTITSPTPTASTSSTADNTNNKRKEDKDSQLNRKTRRCWSPELHRRFLQALQQLGGSHAATPKQIRELMKVDGLTNDEVKSHLQKYRLHTRRPGPSMPNSGNTEPTQFVLVGGIWVPPQNYAAAGTAKGDSPSTTQERVYVPVAAPTHMTLPSHLHQQQQQQQQNRKLLQLSTGSSPSEQKNSRVEHSMGDENAHSGSSAATSSSTETTTASPNF